VHRLHKSTDFCNPSHVDFRDNNNTLPTSEQANKRLDMEINIQHLSTEWATKLLSIVHCDKLSALIDACACGSQWMETLMWKRGYASGTCLPEVYPSNIVKGLRVKKDNLRQMSGWSTPG
jgi:hypothetical protein